MRFDNWMRTTDLSNSSVLKYYGAIEGVLSEWAQESSIISSSILDITSLVKFEDISTRISLLPIFQERNKTGHQMYSSALNKYSEYLEYGVNPSVEEDIDSIVADTEIDTTEKTLLIKTRLGQGQFRKSLISYWSCCSVTSYSDLSILVASHIKPWAKSSNTERLDKFNGLLLTPNLDKVFDKGLISFGRDGNILISPSFLDPFSLGIDDSMSVNLVEEHQDYMEYHRSYVFERI